MNVMMTHDHLGYGDDVLHGVSRLFLDWIPRLEPLDCKAELCIFRARNTLARPFEKRGLKPIFLGRSKYDPRVILDLLKIVRQRRIDLLYAHSLGSATVCRVIRALTGIPLIIHIHDSNPWYPDWLRMLDNILASQIDAVVANSERSKEFYLSEGRLPGVRAEEVGLIRNGVSLGDFHPLPLVARQSFRKLQNLPRECPLVGAITRFFPQKTNDVLLEAFAILKESFPTAHLVLVGDGPLRQKLQDQARRLGLSQSTTWTGFRPPTEIGKWLSIFDVKVFPSEYGDGGTPLPVLEALASGRVVIATRAVGQELIEHGQSGLLVGESRPQELSEAIRSVLADRELRETLERGARERALEFDIDRSVKQITAVFRAVIK